VRRVSLLGLIYIIVGIYIAWTRHYISVSVLKTVLQALLAVFLWFLILLGVDLHVH
jgi:hypothetical protein